MPKRKAESPGAASSGTAKRAARRGGVPTQAASCGKRRPVASKKRILAAIQEKANLTVAESDALDYKLFNKTRLVLFENVSPDGFETSAYYGGADGLHYVLEEGKLICVEAVDRSVMGRIAEFFFCEAVEVTLGHSIRLTPDGSTARYAPLVFLPRTVEESPPRSLGSTLGDYPWPSGVLSYGVSRTLPEHFEDGVALLTTADGGLGRGIRFYLGIHEYREAGQLVVFVMERQSGRIVLREAVSCGTSGLAPSTIQVIRDVINVRGGELRGVGVGGGSCNKLDILEYQLRLPAEMIFDGDPPPKCFPSEFRFDLFRLQAGLLRGDFGAGGFGNALCQGCEDCY